MTIRDYLAACPGHVRTVFLGRFAAPMTAATSTLLLEHRAPSLLDRVCRVVPLKGPTLEAVYLTGPFIAVLERVD